MNQAALREHSGVIEYDFGPESQAASWNDILPEDFHLIGAGNMTATPQKPQKSHTKKLQPGAVSNVEQKEAPRNLTRGSQ